MCINFPCSSPNVSVIANSINHRFATHDHSSEAPRPSPSLTSSQNRLQRLQQSCCDTTTTDPLLPNLNFFDLPATKAGSMTFSSISLIYLSCFSFGDSGSCTNFVLEVVESSKSRFCLLIFELDFEFLGVFNMIKERREFY
ncbi:hypothetical protein HKD37_10G027101 [Glycine soja]